MGKESKKKKRIVSLLTIIISLPLSILGAASQNIVLGVVFGFLLAIGIDSFISTFSKTKLV